MSCAVIGQGLEKSGCLKPFSQSAGDSRFGLATFVVPEGNCRSGLATVTSSTRPLPNPKGRLLSSIDLAVFVGEVVELSLVGSP